MAAAPLPFQDVQKLLLGDYGTFIHVKDWRLEIKSKGSISRFYDLLKSESKRQLIEYLTYCEDKNDFELEETILTYNRGFQNSGYFRIVCINASFVNLSGFIVFVRNVSDEYQAFLRLEKIDAHLSDYFNYSPIAFCLSVNKRVTFLCQKLRTLSGFDHFRDGRMLNEIFPTVAEMSPISIKRNKNVAKATNIVDKKGNATIMDVYTNIMQAKNGEIHLLACMESQSRNKVENELIRHLVGFKQIADNVPGALFQLGFRSSGKVEFSYFSEGSEEVLGISSAKMKSHPECLVQYISSDHAKKLKDSFYEAAANNRIWEDEVALYPRTENERWIRIRGAIRFHQGIFEISGIIHNITDYKKDKEKQFKIQDTLLKVHSHQAIQSGNLEETFKLLSKAAVDCLGVNRVSFWSYCDAKKLAVCDFAISNQTIYSSEAPTLDRGIYSSFFRLLEADHWVCISDVKTLSGLNSFVEYYLQPNNVGSFAAVSIYHNGKLSGLLFAEQLAFPREWDNYELQFLKNLSDIVSYVHSVNEKSSFEAELVYLNNHLSQLVQSRTEELSRKQELLELKNDEIVSSLRYAKHIQSAILPHKDYFERLFPESFVFYQPKDIVAGDFYWAESMTIPGKLGDNEIAMVAACDCTGHGVPGAMMSMLASSALSRALHQYSLNDPGDILFQVNQILRENMNKSRNEIFDGMDTALCSIAYTNFERTEVKLKFSGANSPLWIFRNNNLLGYEHQIIKGNKMSVGMHQTQSLFDVHEVNLKKGDVIYLFSDGFVDQFGGPNGKKLKYPRMRDMLLEIIHLPMSIQRRCIESAFEMWKGDNEQIDDVLLIGIKL